MILLQIIIIKKDLKEIVNIYNPIAFTWGGSDDIELNHFYKLNKLKPLDIKFYDLSDSGFINADSFVKAMTRLGVNSVNEDNVQDYFNLYDTEKTGRINYRDFVSNLFSPNEMRRKKMIENFEKSGKKLEIYMSILIEKIGFNLA